MPYLQEFLVIAAIHFLAVASPGPDFAVILKQSVRYGRRSAIFTSLGIGSGILLHVAYSLVGIGILIASSESLFTLLKFIAAAYFLYLAWHGLRAKPNNDESFDLNIKTLDHPSDKKSFITGFLVNGLNVKATLFFVSLFSMVIATSTPFAIKLGYGLYMAIATAAWFSSLSYFLSITKFRQLLIKKGYWLERVMGIILLALAIKLLFSSL
ncbi:MAG: lysine transporter LysE [Gammaproteobacteria bacterium]|nr:MAG: lysine transporter LysE [Gammaproteobacteria bacterium]